jgi:hypothetical protein
METARAKKFISNFRKEDVREVFSIEGLLDRWIFAAKQYNCNVNRR